MKSKRFSDAFFDSLPTDTDEACIIITDEYANFYSTHNADPDYNHDFLEVYAFVEAFFQGHNVEAKLPTVAPGGYDRGGFLEELKRIQKKARERVALRKAAQHLEEKKKEYQARFAKVPTYNFADDDFARIQQLINEIRDVITTASTLDKRHKERLLYRLEAVQRELHKQTSDIDRFWSFLADVRINAYKFGEDLKPLVERTEELARIVIATVASTEGIQALPHVTDLLLK